jgi:hypothetical protein
MMKGSKTYLLKSSEMELLTVLKYFETILKVIMRKFVKARLFILFMFAESIFREGC